MFKVLYQNKHRERLEKLYGAKKVLSKIRNEITDGGKSIDNFRWIRMNMTPKSKTSHNKDTGTNYTSKHIPSKGKETPRDNM